MRKTMFVLFVSLFLLLLSACSQKVNDAADVKAIEKAVQDYAKGYSAKDANALASLMTDDGVFAQANSPAVVGKEAAQKLLQGVFAQYEQSDIELGCSTADIQIRGDLGVAHGTYAFKVLTKQVLSRQSRIREIGLPYTNARGMVPGNVYQASAIATILSQARRLTVLMKKH